MYNRLFGYWSNNWLPNGQFWPNEKSVHTSTRPYHKCDSCKTLEGFVESLQAVSTDHPDRLPTSAFWRIVMTISLKQNPNHPSLEFDSTVIEEVRNHKHLGLTIQKWNCYIENICTTGHKRFDILSNLKYKLDRRSLEILYLSFIRPIPSVYTGLIVINVG